MENKGNKKIILTRNWWVSVVRPEGRRNGWVRAEKAGRAGKTADSVRGGWNERNVWPPLFKHHEHQHVFDGGNRAASAM